MTCATNLPRPRCSYTDFPAYSDTLAGMTKTVPLSGLSVIALTASISVGEDSKKCHCFTEIGVTLGGES